MATIPLRDYCREIENMIDKGHTDEAIGHSRHILKHFPKHIDTYRLLGKSYLESRQLGDAADIFQRVLSSIPEDFVSHIGMSIIREDEGNLDAAIWHMERAFEVQSSNIAIQDELKRLYTHRDGQEPPKIRLTRGALAHMYATGHLYAQAIGELRAVLATDPKRLDLQVLLAKMYHADNQPANAAKTASQLLTKLPYCLDANRILAEILTSSQRANEATVHNTRIQELDPYYKHVSSQYPTVDLVPSGVIVLEALDWEATKGGLISQPAWATSIGVDISNAPASEELPEWLSSSSGSGSRDRNAAFGDMVFDEHLSNLSTSPQTWEAPEEDVAPYQESTVENNLNEATMMQEDDDNIPDWMKSAGWGQRDPNQPEEPPAPLFDDEEDEPTSGDDEIAKASIPDWLKAMAPSDLSDIDEDPSESPESADLPDWLQGFNAGETVPSRVSSSPPQSTPSWMSSGSEASDDAELELPDWLNEGNQTVQEPQASASLPQADVPDWLRDIGGTPEAAEQNTEFPDWLGSPEDDAQPKEAFSLDDMEESTAPEWLQEIGDDVVSSTLPSTPQSSQMPDWLSDESAESGLEPSAVEDIFGQTEEVSSPAGASWLDELIQDEDDPSLHSGVTDWLSTKEDAEMEDALPASNIPDWLQDFGEDVPGETELSEPQESVSSMESAAPTFDMSDLGKDAGQSYDDEFGLGDDAMAWLESLAAKQGAKEEELLIKPENRQDSSLPSWLSEITEEPVEEASPAEDEEAIPDWLRGMTEEPEAAVLPGEEESMTFDMGESASMEEENAPSMLDEMDMPAMAEDDDAAMAWLEGLAAKQGAKEEELLTAPTERSEDVPEWLQGILVDDTPEAEMESATSPSETDLDDIFGEQEPLSFEQDEQETAFNLEPEPMFSTEEAETILSNEASTEDASLDEDAALAWLESLAMKHGVNEEELLTAAETRPEDTPDWVNAVAEEARAEEEAASLLEQETSHEPDFLMDVAHISTPDTSEGEWMEEESELPVQEVSEDSSWLSELLQEEEEVPLSATDDVPEWVTASTADLLAGSASVETPTESPESAQDMGLEEEIEMPAWLLEDEQGQASTEVPAWVLDEPATEDSPALEAELPAWLQEEEPVEETPLPIFDETETVPDQRAEPAMEFEPQSEPEPMVEIPMAVDTSEVLTQARNTLSSGDVSLATQHYEKLIKNNQNVDEAIVDITEALNTRYPVDIGLWQTLGDAYVKKNKLQDALDSYTKAEELLR